MFRRPPPQGGSPREVSEILNGVLNGKTNNTGVFTLNIGGATTTNLENPLISRDSKIIIIPFSAPAFADTSAIRATSQTNGQAIITHTANTTADKVYAFIIVA